MNGNARPRAGARSVIAAIAVTMAVGAVATGCGDSGSGSGAADPTQGGPQQGASQAGTDEAQGPPKAGGNLNFDFVGVPKSLDLFQVATEPEIYAVSQIFEPLLVQEVSGEVVPHLAESVTASDDGKTWTVELKPGVKFSDDTPVTAADVKFSLDTARAKDSSASGRLAVVSAVRVEDPRTIAIRLEEPFSPLPETLTYYGMSIVPKDFGGKDRKAFFEDPVGTGPFQVREWERGQRLVVERNENYWQEGRPYLDTVTIQGIAEANTRLVRLRGRQSDISAELPLPSVKQVESNPALRVGSYPSARVDLLMINVRDEDLGDVHARRAISLAIDRQAIATGLLQGQATPANSLVSNKYEFWDEGAPGAEFDLERAKAELARSGTPNGFSATLQVESGNTTDELVAQAIQEQLEAIGIEVGLKRVDPSVHYDVISQGDFEFALGWFLSNSPSAYANMDIFNTITAPWQGYDASELIALNRRAAAALDDSEAAELYAQEQRKLVEDAPLITLFYRPLVYGLSKDVRGFAIAPYGIHRWGDVWLDR